MSNLDALIKINPALALQQHASRMTEAQLDGYCQTRTRDVLKIAAGKLTPAQLEHCSRTDPHSTLEFAADLLTTAQVEECARQAPAKALLFASHRLGPEQIIAAAESATGKLRTVIGIQPDHPVVDALNTVRHSLDPKLTTSLDRALEKRKESNQPPVLPRNGEDPGLAQEIRALTPEELAQRSIDDPLTTLIHAGHRLHPDQIVKAAGRCGPQIRSVLQNKPGHPVALVLAAVAPRLTNQTRRAVKEAFEQRAL